jgi:hypothetical protein
MEEIKQKTDRELMVMSYDLANTIASLQRQLQIVEAEIVKRIKEEKAKGE